MKFLLIILTPFLIGCNKKNKSVDKEYFVRGTFLDTSGAETVFIEFSDSLVSMIAQDGSFKKGTWTTRIDNDGSKLVTTFRRSTTFQIIDFNPNSITL
jgi:CRISPR/Cas system CSM-associated protein Csm5 (group 7 of RAMP superfamily)